MGGAELQHEVQDAEKRGRGPEDFRRQWLDEINRGSGLWPGRAQEFRQRLHPVTSLDLLYIIKVSRVESCVRYTANTNSVSERITFFTPSGNSAFPARPGDEETATFVAGGAAPDVIEVERIQIDELDAEIARLFDGRDGDHDGFSAQGPYQAWNTVYPSWGPSLSYPQR